MKEVEFPKGDPVWDFDNPLFKKKINGITYRITKDNGSTDPNSRYSLFADKKRVGNYENVDVAQNEAVNHSRKNSKGMSMGM